MSPWGSAPQNVHLLLPKPATPHLTTTTPNHSNEGQSSRSRLSPCPRQGKPLPATGSRAVPPHTRRGRPEGREPRRWEPRVSRLAEPAPCASAGRQHPGLSPQVSLTSRGRSGLGCLGLSHGLLACSHQCLRCGTAKRPGHHRDAAGPLPAGSRHPRP